MSRMTKVLLVLVALLGIIQTVWFMTIVYPLQGVITFFNNLNLPQQWIRYTGLGLGILAGLAFLVMFLYALFAPAKHKNINFSSNKGDLTISKDAIEKMVCHKVQENPAIEDVDVRVNLTGSKQKSEAKILAKSARHEDLVQQGEQIKEAVTAQLNEVLGIPVKKVVVKLAPLGADEQRRVV